MYPTLGFMQANTNTEYVVQSEVSYMQFKGQVIVMGDLNVPTGEQQNWITMDTSDYGCK